MSTCGRASFLLLEWKPFDFFPGSRKMAIENFSRENLSGMMPWLVLFSWNPFPDYKKRPHLLVEKNAEVPSAYGSVRELHEIRPIQRRRLFAPSDRPALRHAEGLLVPIRICRA